MKYRHIEMQENEILRRLRIKQNKRNINELKLKSKSEFDDSEIKNADDLSYLLGESASDKDKLEFIKMFKDKIALIVKDVTDLLNISVISSSSNFVIDIIELLGGSIYLESIVKTKANFWHIFNNLDKDKAKLKFIEICRQTDRYKEIVINRMEIDLRYVYTKFSSDAAKQKIAAIIQADQPVITHLSGVKSTSDCKPKLQNQKHSKLWYGFFGFVAFLGVIAILSGIGVIPSLALGSLAFIISGSLIVASSFIGALVVYCKNIKRNAFKNQQGAHEYIPLDDLENHNPAEQTEQEFSVVGTPSFFVNNSVGGSDNYDKKKSNIAQPIASQRN